MSEDSNKQRYPIGIFDSGYGGLTILRQIRQYLPQYDYLYLGDNARAPYGPRSFEVIYKYTLEAVEALFARGCRFGDTGVQHGISQSFAEHSANRPPTPRSRPPRTGRDSPHGGGCA